jgi:hypothetical protein
MLKESERNCNGLTSEPKWMIELKGNLKKNEGGQREEIRHFCPSTHT